jgi:hypothetical protein
MSRDYTNVGYAMTVGALYSYEDYEDWLWITIK